MSVGTKMGTVRITSIWRGTRPIPTRDPCRDRSRVVIENRRHGWPISELWRPCGTLIEPLATVDWLVTSGTGEPSRTPGRNIASRPLLSSSELSKLKHPRVPPQRNHRRGNSVATHKYRNANTSRMAFVIRNASHSRCDRPLCPVS